MRKHWKFKFAVQSILSTIPGGMALNDTLQQTMGDLKNFDDFLRRKINDFQFFANQTKINSGSPKDLCIAEVGTGWLPLLPILFYLCGARSIHTYDKVAHFNLKLTQKAISALGQYVQLISTWTGESEEAIQSRLDKIQNVSSSQDLFQKTGIHYHAPGDAATTNLPPSSVDMIFSNSVLEHIPQPVLKDIFVESRRILKPTGIAIHGVNCGDHYAYFDRGITQINYLQYSEDEWKRWSNNLLYQNRMRPRDFHQIVTESGLTISFERRSARAGCREAFERLKIAPQFHHYNIEDLVCTSFDFVAKPQAQV